MAIVMNNLEAKASQKKAAPAGAPASGLKSENIFGMMATYLQQGLGKDQVKKVEAIFTFQITAKKGAKPSLIYNIDLKNG